MYLPPSVCIRLDMGEQRYIQKHLPRLNYSYLVSAAQRGLQQALRWLDKHSFSLLHRYRWKEQTDPDKK